jgi:hypothetical protein
MSSFATSTVETSTIPDPASLKKTAAEISDERRAKFEKAYDLAIATIVKGAGEKMKSDAEQGRFRSILYTFFMNTTKDAENDKNNTLIRFGGVYLRDMITKGHVPFFRKLATHFNNEAKSSAYHCSFFRNKEADDSVSYNIYVSWASPPRTRPPQTDGFVLAHNPRPHHPRGDGAGRGASPGRGPGRGAGRGAGRGDYVRQNRTAPSDEK